MNTTVKKLKRAQHITVIGCILLLVLSMIGWHLALAQVQKERLSLIGALAANDTTTSSAVLDSLFTLQPSAALAAKGETYINSSGYSSHGAYYLYSTLNSYYQGYHLFLLFALLLCFLLIIASLAPWRRWQTELILAEEKRQKELTDIQEILAGNERFLAQKTRQLQAFIENISHQIKTPLSCISVALDSALDKQDLQEIPPAFTYIEKIKQLLYKLLTLARLEAGKIMFEYEDVNMQTYLAELSQRMTSQNAHCHFTDETVSPVIWHIDSEWMQEALCNILSDCIEHHTPGTSIEISLSSHQDSDILTFANEGAGIPEDALPHIFDRFYTADCPSYRHTGIGLNLSKLIIETHHASIYARNNNETGRTEFLIVFPHHTLKNKLPL